MKDKNKGHHNHVSRLEPSSTLDSKQTAHDNPRPKQRSRNSFDKPTPLDFDAFVPWVCLEWQSPKIVIVTRIIREECIKNDRRNSSSRSKSNKILKFKPEDLESTTEPKRTTGVPTLSRASYFMTRSSIVDSAIPIKAYYDNRGHLVEIAITDCPLEIHKKVIQAISICIPFHSLLTKLTIRRGGVTNALLHEIGKMLPHSNLTDICLDDCIVPEGNYDVIFEHTSQLKYLSLNRCNINNTVCKTLAEKIDFGFPGSSLLILELGSNFISDRGAKALGESLRRNRRLLHLNLSGNKVTDVGAISILSHLMEFRLTWNEIVDARKRKLKYTEKKMEVYASCYEEVMKRQRSDMMAGSSTARQSFKAKNLKHLKEDIRKKSKKNPNVFVEEKSAVEIATTMVLDIVGKFIDPYDENSVAQKEDHAHSIGNMVLCSLNFAYNSLSFMSVKKIYEVLKYQNRIVKPPETKGLIRIVFDGNHIPIHCIEYDRIEMFLRKVINDNAPIVALGEKKRTASATASKIS